MYKSMPAVKEEGHVDYILSFIEFCIRRFALFRNFCNVASSRKFRSFGVNVGIAALPFALPYLHFPAIYLTSITRLLEGRSDTDWKFLNSKYLFPTL
jgi:hypothetical protein